MVSEEDFPEDLRVTEKLRSYNEKNLDNRHLIPEIKVTKLGALEEDEEEEEKKQPWAISTNVETDESN